jgi:5-methylcytosine-specific restriction endonuclease McrA
MEIDHIIPESAGGVTDLENLCLACVSCNQYKRERQQATDTETGETVSLFNPRTQVWADHFAWNDENLQILTLSATARATVHLLRLNREAVVNARKKWRLAG